jgi:hypothetical protein
MREFAAGWVTRLFSIIGLKNFEPPHIACGGM